MRPKLGIYYKEAHERLNRINKIENPNPFYKQRLTNSLLHQASLAEGEGAKSELMKEFTEKSSFLSGAGNKQVGYGPSKITVMSNSDRRKLGIEQDSNLPDYIGSAQPIKR